MEFRFRQALLAIAIVVTGATPTMAEEPAKPQVERPKAPVKKGRAARQKPAPPVKLVDINSASKAELMTLPSMTADFADKVIAGRPYGSKSHLLTHKILPGVNYDAVKGLVIAKQPFAEASKNAEAIAKAKRQP
jgi:DNA uptake protein ComE-like DNA-binding protein